MNLNEEKRIPLCCEICLKNEKDVSHEMIKTAAHKWLLSLGITITLGRHDPNKIICDLLNKYCDYIVIEPAIPIKIVKEYNGSYDSDMYGELYSTYYSVYDVNNSHYNLNINDKLNCTKKENETNNLIPSWRNCDNYDNANNLMPDQANYNNYEHEIALLPDRVNYKNYEHEINLLPDPLTYYSSNNDTNLPLTKKKENLSNRPSTSSLVSSIAVPQNVVYCSPTYNEIKNKEKMKSPNILFTVPVIGEKSISSMEEDPIILPNFCCIVNVVTYYKNDDFIEEQFNETSENEEEEKKDIPIYSQYILPHLRFHKLWDTLYYEENIKRDLLEYVSALMLFATKKIDSNLINYNHLVLLYGPPGTGKTSLCKALANKICIRLSNIYTTGILIELNAHTLFSKWFSESGKQVLKLFNKIKKIINDYEENDIFICLLIDEVESLSADRKRSMGSTEPSDSIRVVNTLLTQIDSLKYYHNTLLLTTSNISEMIDDAFIDRVDLKQFIGLPNEECRYEIYKDCIGELIEKGIVCFSSKIPSYQRIQKLLKNEKDKAKDEYNYGYELVKCSKMSKGFSGRCLRRIPFQAYAYFCQATLRFYNSTINNQQNAFISLQDFLVALQMAIQKEVTNKNKLLEQKM
ncbi:AAA family ATPase [Plasmodium brasilianum]|uniref:AAA family ATPase, putative n=2 Tax=Plasmodium (Plasmodium) TaxID=418103 RepID=A0A1D3PC98_PLAMA|nr:AAA family ATPase, putative [Plasmodium malariae]KAI4838510.1 AAA family ATPase [Plasmodium brasilianum]SCN12910.1 AAA family ATPase, putative [Plasmodium malariae]